MSLETKERESLNLLNIYLTDYIHRGQILWSQVFKFFYATIVVTMLPNISGFLGLTLPPLPVTFFRIIGIIMSFAFLYIGIGYCKRLKAISDVYLDLHRKFNKNYPREDFGKLFRPRLSYFLVYVMFISLLGIAIILLIFA